MWRPEFRRLPQIVAGIISKSGTIIRRATKKFTVVQQPRFRRPLLISSGIMGITAIIALGFIGLFNYMPDTSVPFPYVPPPEGDMGGYMVSTVNDLTTAFQAHYTTPFVPEDFVGQSFMIKDVIIPARGLTTKWVEFYGQGGELLGSGTMTYLIAGLIEFIPENPSRWQKLKADDVVDIIGVCAGTLQGYNNIIVFRNCRFLPAGVAPLPLPGGPAPVTGY